MCGIAGVFHPGTPKPVEPQRVRAMIAAQAHRGADGEGVWTAPGIGLGHRRLSTTDLHGLHQPMRDGALTVTYDGEIYNFAELRAELERKGARFATAGNTEVLLHGWRRWGSAMLDRLDGMFAFALYDAGRQCLFVARDRLGMKPLHWCELPDGSVAFASELKGLLAHPLLRRVPDVTAVEDYLAYGYVPDDACLVAGVRKLAAGHYFLAERGRPLAIRQWWDVDFSRRAGGSAATLGEELIERMRAAVRSHIVADVPLGAFLSGGVDSSAVVALMAEASGRAVTTCTIGFDKTDPDERRYATEVARRFATAHHERVVRADDAGLIDTLVAAFDEPFADASALAAYQSCALAREHVTVALSGDGADETLAGYGRYRFQAAKERVRTLLPPAIRAPLFGRLGALYPKAEWAPRPLRAKTTLLALAQDSGEAYAQAVGVTAPGMRTRLFSSEARRALGGHRAEDRYVAAFRDAPALSPLDRAQYADLKIRLPGDILTKTDRTSMAVGLEVRVPLLDHRLVAFAASLRPSLRLRYGEGKWLMKRALERYLPREVLYRPKMDFVTPVGAWLHGSLAGEAAALERSRVLAETGWFDMVALGALAADHRAGRADHGRTLWQFLMLERSLTRLFG